MIPKEPIPITELQSSPYYNEELHASAESTLIACSDALIRTADTQIQQGIREGFVKLGNNFHIILHDADLFNTKDGLLAGAINIIYIHATPANEDANKQPVLVFGYNDGSLETLQLHQNINDPSAKIYQLETDPIGQLLPSYENSDAPIVESQIEGTFSSDIYDELSDISVQAALNATHHALIALDSQKTKNESGTNERLDYVSAHNFCIKIHDILTIPNIPSTEAAQDYIQSELSLGNRVAIYKVDGKQVLFEEDIESGLRTMSVRTTDRNFVLGLIRITTQRYSVNAETLETSYGEEVIINDKKGNQSLPKLSDETIALNAKLDESLGFTTFTQGRLADALDLYTRCKQDPSLQVL